NKQNAALHEVEAVQGAVNRKSLAEFAGPAAEVGAFEANPTGSNSSKFCHFFNAFEGLQGPDEHRHGLSLAPADHVHAVVHAVGEIDVRRPGTGVHRLVAGGAPASEGVGCTVD